MRQNFTSAADTKFRTALTNMRYAACTPADIAFLKSRVVGLKEGRPASSDARFRSVPIITSWNSQKDKINELGGSRYADDTRQELVHFYSNDTLSPHADSNDRIAPKLRGMPVMIRNNDATELCITKGQEGIVVGWHEEKGDEGQRVLDTLLVKLLDPPKAINIPGLTENVVALCKASKKIWCLSLAGFRHDRLFFAREDTGDSERSTALYQLFKGSDYDPLDLHPALAWRAGDAARLQEPQIHGEWALVGSDKVPEKTADSKSAPKRKLKNNVAEQVRDIGGRKEFCSFETQSGISTAVPGRNGLHLDRRFSSQLTGF
ncbi:hypothetical protein B0H10DRAFT_1943580 [Mycena sp. CBHHK59/15]|nr:hypothetical protein B0H10DRAFT_1943580 [Mycena sp. CBHHK59/15]